MHHQPADSHATEGSFGFARLPTVLRRTGLARSTIYRMMAKQEFPEPFQISKRAVGWKFTDLDRWEESRKTAGS